MIRFHDVTTRSNRATEALRTAAPWLVLSLVAACSAAPTSPGAQVPAPTAPAGAAKENQPMAGGPWLTQVFADHPLVGRIVDGRSGSFATRADVEAATRRARFVLLGEKHDNPDHHRLQQALLEEILRSGRRPAVVLEMLDRSQQPALEAWRSSASTDPEAFAEAVGWNERGWDWPLYRDLIGVALRHEAPLLTGNLPRSDVRAIAKQGEEAEALAALTLPPLPADQLDALRATMRDAHCGVMPEAMLPNMVLVQRARDAVMAEELRRGATGDGAVLIAGAGHVRRDRGVPRALDVRDAEVLTIAFVEVRQSLQEPTDYLADSGTAPPPFDFVWFTPRVDDRDPCDELRAHTDEHRRAAR